MLFFSRKQSATDYKQKEITMYVKLSRSKIYHCMRNKIELPNFELPSWSHSELLVTISSMNLSSEISKTFLWGFPGKNIQFPWIIRTWLLQEMSSYRSRHRRFREVLLNVHHRGGGSTNFKRLRQCYSTTPKKQKPKQILKYVSYWKDPFFFLIYIYIITQVPKSIFVGPAKERSVNYEVSSTNGQKVDARGRIYSHKLAWRNGITYPN